MRMSKLFLRALSALLALALILNCGLTTFAASVDLADEPQAEV